MDNENRLTAKQAREASSSVTTMKLEKVLDDIYTNINARSRSSRETKAVAIFDEKSVEKSVLEEAERVLKADGYSTLLESGTLGWTMKISWGE
ncbi:hypothetical protein [Vreelandella sp. TE19]